MVAIVTRAGKGSPLTNVEVDANFTNLNAGKLELGQSQSGAVANSVLFFNGSSVVSSGSSLTFNGTTLTAPGFSGPLTGNASTATALQNSRTLWGQSFNGTANITAPLLPAAGSVSAPAFSVTGDVDTGIYFPAADTLGVTIGGVEAARFNSSRNLLIGGTLSASRTASFSPFGNGTDTNFAAVSPGTAQGQLAGYSFRPTFMGTTDNVPRRSADIWSGFSGGAWGNEFLAIGVGNNGAQNDTALTTAEKLRILSSGTVFLRDGSSTVNTNNSRLVVGGTISETVSNVQMLVVSQTDIGTAPNQLPLNQYLGDLAYQNADAIAGNVTIGGGVTANGASAINVNSTSDALRITQTGTGNAFVVEDSASPDSTPFVIDASGNIVSGSTTPYPSPINSSFVNRLQLHSISQYGATIDAVSWQAGTDVGANLVLARSDSGTVGAHTLIGSTDVIGNIRFYGSDGTKFVDGARISAVADGTPGTDSMPVRLVFSTTPSGSGTPAERVRINSAGNVLIGTTVLDGIGGLSLRPLASMGAAQIAWNRAANASTSIAAVFYTAGVSSGGIIYGDTTTTFVTSSDHRLKENVRPMSGALSKVSALKPVTYTWKVNGSPGQGFIAHELQEVVPECVTGEKDAVDADGKPIYQGVDASFLVATLAAAIQEQQAIIAALTARVEALEGAQA